MSASCAPSRRSRNCASSARPTAGARSSASTGRGRTARSAWFPTPSCSAKAIGIMSGSPSVYRPASSTSRRSSSTASMGSWRRRMYRFCGSPRPCRGSTESRSGSSSSISTCARCSASCAHRWVRTPASISSTSGATICCIPTQSANSASTAASTTAGRTSFPGSSRHWARPKAALQSWTMRAGRGSLQGWRRWRCRKAFG